MALLALAFPRIIIAVLFFTSAYLERAIHSSLLLIAGFLFLPLTTLAYAWAINSTGTVAGLYLVLLILAVLSDLGALGGGARHRRRW
jgi:hypothetical protein